mmetsp:Transcript_125256/g.217096  ORF Transcript_125256/g.217096 Transcript_125256/m.217096 type:complete len:316 (+) Transcript_125256:2559-3506(+)
MQVSLFNQLLCCKHGTKFGQSSSLLLPFILAHCTKDHACEELRVSLARNFLFQNCNCIVIVVWISCVLFQQSLALRKNLLIRQLFCATVNCAVTGSSSSSRTIADWAAISVTVFVRVFIILSATTTTTTRTFECRKHICGSRCCRCLQHILFPSTVLPTRLSNCLKPFILLVLLLFGLFEGLRALLGVALRGFSSVVVPAALTPKVVPRLLSAQICVVGFCPLLLLILSTDPVGIPELNHVQDQKLDALHGMYLRDLCHFLEIHIHMRFGLHPIKLLPYRVQHFVQRFHGFNVPWISMVCVEQQDLDDNVHNPLR